MLIILEGPDCAGKSTLAREIHDYVAAVYEDPLMLHKGPPREHPLDEYVAPLIGYRPGKHGPHGFHIVCDRWHVGEAVYPEVLGRRSLMTPGMLRYVELFLQSRGAVTVPVMPPIPTIVERMRERGDDLVTEAMLPKIYESFAHRFKSLRTMMTFSPEVDAFTVVMGAIQMADRTRRLNRFETYIGHVEPNVLFFGDVRNCRGSDDCRHRVHHPAGGPAFMPYPNTSGEYLFESLEFLPRRVGLANACDVDDASDLWLVLGAPKVVALGQRAHLELNRREVPHATVPHPQFVRRFHYHVGRAQYVELIQRIIGTERNELQWRPSRPRPAGTLTPVS